MPESEAPVPAEFSETTTPSAEHRTADRSNGSGWADFGPPILPESRYPIDPNEAELSTPLPDWDTFHQGNSADTPAYSRFISATFSPEPEQISPEEDEELPVARSSREARVFMDMTACDCGETRFERTEVVVARSDGRLARHHSGCCEYCGEDREFVFLVPAAGEIPDDDPRFGAERASELIDAGGWLWVSDEYAEAAGEDAADPAQGVVWLTCAAAAIDEVVKFIPAGRGAVPPTALWSRIGLDMYAQDPDRFRADLLGAQRDSYLDRLSGLRRTDASQNYGPLSDDNLADDSRFAL
ncbi:hypothetical protein [Nocardia panacis]|uniref:hypothetical protein n=1 Tax=Nocardia panacis TaxID=2340916 RepID=UPI0011C3AA46|nr:hypothetical protein [Nocardia panacis]